MKFEKLKNNFFILKRNRSEERYFNYTKIYDLSKIDTIENISFEEKRNILITIKKILLSTNDYITTSNITEIIKYIMLSTVVFLLYIILYTNFYKAYFIVLGNHTDSYMELSFMQKIYYYYSFELLEIMFRIIYNIIKKKKIKKVMVYYARSLINKEESNYNLYIDDYNYNLFIINKSMFSNLFEINKENEPFLKESKYNFYQYVINYPNCRYYKWDKNILNEKENEIVNEVMKTIQSEEKELLKKNRFFAVIIWILYFLSFKSLVKGEKLKSIFYRIVIFVFTKIISYFMSNSFRNLLKEKEEILSKHYMKNGYFILLHFTVIQIFKLKDEYTANLDKNTGTDTDTDPDNTNYINEVYKYIHKNVMELNEKILEKNNNNNFNINNTLWHT
jgi:hypothetical protein